MSKPRCRTAAKNALLLACLAAGIGQAETVPSWDDYAVVIARNVFDPSRTGARPEPPSGAGAPASVPPFVELTGLLIRNDRALAFTNSTNPEWSGVMDIVPDQPAGPGVVTAVNSKEVELTIHDQPLTWRVGTRLTQDGDTWSVAAAAAESDEAASAAPAQANAAAGPAASSATADILKRLMERRKKETEQ